MAAPVAAGERAGAVSLSPFVGGYTFDGVQKIETAPVYGLRLGIDLTKHLGMELVGSYLSTEGTGMNGTSINAISYRMDFLYNLFPDGPLVPYLAVGGGGITFGHGSDGLKIRKETTDGTANAGLGFKYFLTDSIALRGDARQIFLFEEHTSLKYNWEYTAGLTFLFGGTSAPAPVPPATTSSLSLMPGSIVKGEQATLNWSSQNATSCSMTPGSGSIDTQGSMTITPSSSTTYYLTCNGPGGTSNNSSSITVSEPLPTPLAPTSSLSVNPLSITQGEAATLAWTSENAVKCDIQPGIGPVQPQGTVKITPVADSAYTLNCSGPGGSTTSVVNLSVVVPPPPAPVKPAPVVFTPEKEESVNLLIEFDFNKSVVKPAFYANVNAAGEFMQKYPAARITIEGHTDSVGKKAYNQKLSLRRAEAVKKYIVAKFGIDAKRIKAVGYGETKPIDTNKTAEGRYHNRRVQAHHAAVK
jgi:OOP family OmpA-OmpF porin